MTGFNTLNLSGQILSALEKLQYKEPSDIQQKAIPIILSGSDLIALAPTGSGKTAACAIPLCHKIDVDNNAIQALIVVPTRELALQYATEAQKIGKVKEVKSYALFGGEDYSLQAAKLKSGVHFLVATPGRLIDYIYNRNIDLTAVNTLVFDEADEMLSMGFYDDLEFIINCLVHDHQTLLFSATMPPHLVKIAKQHLKEPQEISLIKEEASPARIDHKFVWSRHDMRSTKLVELLESLQPAQSIIFCPSRHLTDQVCRYLQKKVRGVDFLHAGMSQELRTTITNKFRQGKVKHLVATDVASRGLDFSGVTHVFIFQLSSDIDTYVHRAGRTGRFEKNGVAISFVTERERYLLPRILHRLNIPEAAWIGEPPPPSLKHHHRSGERIRRYDHAGPHHGKRTR